MDSTRRNVQVALLCALTLVMLGGCSVRKFTVNQTADLLYRGAPALERESDVEFARAALPASLKTVETFLLSSPDNKQLLELLGKGYFSYAFGFLEGDLERGQYEAMSEDDLRELNRRSVLHYLRARDYGFLLLDKSALEEAARGGDRDALGAELSKLKKKDVPGLFWASYGWGAAINLSQDNPDMVAGLSIVQQMMDRVIELDDDYFYAGAHAFYGVTYASMPPMAGGDPEKALQHFDIALQRHGEYNMMLHYLKARFYAPAVQDRDYFIDTMEKVANANIEGHPNVRLNNEIARERAIWWLGHIDELIIE